MQAGAPLAQAFLAAVGLAAIAGWVDAVAYLGLHSYVANMTGVVVLLGLAGADLDLPGVGRQALILSGFMAGVLLSRLLRRLGWGPAPSYALSSVVVLACIGRLGAGPLAVAALALSMGLQNAASTVFGGVGLNTVFLTGNMQRLGEFLSPDPATSAPATSVPATSGTRRGFAPRLLPAVVLMYAVGAAAGALALRHLAGCSAVAAGPGLGRRGRHRPDPRQAASRFQRPLISTACKPGWRG